MNKQIICAGIVFAMIFSGCQPDAQSNNQEHLLQSLTWFQQSAEMKAIYIQSFNWAGKVMMEKLELESELPMAVVLDIDETVLDNSPQTARQVRDGVPFSNEMWDEWCGLAQAEALPGALEFTLKAETLGVEVFYISNRGIHLLDVTLENLNSTGFPYADAGHVLLKTDTSAKDDRRAKVRQSHNVVLLIGDNLGDFTGIFDMRLHGADSENVLAHRESFGFEYIILPNPLYGGWEKEFRGESPEETRLNKMDALEDYQP